MKRTIRQETFASPGNRDENEGDTFVPSDREAIGNRGCTLPTWQGIVADDKATIQQQHGNDARGVQPAMVVKCVTFVTPLGKCPQIQEKSCTSDALS